MKNNPKIKVFGFVILLITIPLILMGQNKNIFVSANFESDINGELGVNQTMNLEDILIRMSLEQKVGQMLMLGFDGKTAENFFPLQQKFHPGGIILFRRNIQAGEQLHQLIDKVQERAYETDKMGMFVSVDLEGGRVVHLPKAVTQKTFLPAARWGKLYHTNQDEALKGISLQTSEMAEILKKNKINMNLAPVLDLKTGKDNSIIGDRAFDDSEENVAILGSEWIRTSQNEGIISVAKHFPGHGVTITDTHKLLPTSKPDIMTLKKHLFPFEKVVQNGVDIIMMNHISYPDYDQLPASLSKYWITGQLRENLGFQGVVMTDAMEMGAITSHYQWEEAIVNAVNAGNDIILVSSGGKYLTSAGDIIMNAVKSGRFTEERIDDSVRRILKLKMKYGLINL